MWAKLGRTVPLSLGRRVVCDLLDAGTKLPLIPIEREMHVEEIVAARQEAFPRPSWCGIFTKAYAKVVAARPDLRRAMLTWPWVRLFEYKAVSADIVVDACVHGENVPVFVPLKAPQTLPLVEIDQLLHACKENPLERLPRYRRALRLARSPRFVRRWVWWCLLNVSPLQRAKHFGTFGVSSMANWGVDSLRPIGPNTTLLHYGVVNAQGRTTVRLTFDHRVMDGCGASTALLEMEKILCTDILAELKTLRSPVSPHCSSGTLRLANIGSLSPADGNEPALANENRRDAS